MKIALVIGTVRIDRQGPKVGKYFRHMCEEREWEVFYIDPMDYDLPLLQQMYKSMDEPQPIYNELHNIFEEVDGFLFITAEYNHGVPAALKNLIDHYQQEFYWKPSAIVSYSAGSFGGVRAAEQLRLICAELGMPSIPTSMPIPKIESNFDDNGEPAEGKSYLKRTKRFLDEFEWYLKAFKAQRSKGTPY